MGFFREFKEFAMKGNVMDMAVGLVIGTAFQSIIKSLVEDVIMPFTALFTGDVDYTNWIINISNVQIRIGSFVTAVINFLIIALSIFLALKCIIKINKHIEKMNKEMEGRLSKKMKWRKQEEKIEPETKTCPYCLSEIKYKASRCPHCTSELEKEHI